MRSYYKRDLRGRRFSGDIRRSKFRFCDLRDCSFRGCNLTGSDFSDSDIRGCDFSDSILNESKFERVKAGRSTKQIFALLINGGFLWAFISSSQWINFLYTIYLIVNRINEKIKPLWRAGLFNMPKNFLEFQPSFISPPEIYDSISINSIGEDKESHDQNSSSYDDEYFYRLFNQFSQSDGNIIREAVSSTFVALRVLGSLFVDLFVRKIFSLPYILFKSVFGILINILVAVVKITTAICVPIFAFIICMGIAELIFSRHVEYFPYLALMILVTGIIGVAGLIEKTSLALSLVIPTTAFLVLPVLRIFNAIEQQVTVKSQDLRQFLETIGIGFNSAYDLFLNSHQTRNLYYLTALSIFSLFVFYFMRIVSLRTLSKTLYLNLEKEYLFMFGPVLEIGYGTSFENSSAVKCNFESSILRDCNFDNSLLNGAKFDNSNINMSRFKNANLSVVSWAKSSFLFCLLPDYFESNIDIFRELLIERVGIQKNYEGRDLRNQFLEDCCLDNCSLRRANISGSVFYKASMRSVDLTEVQALDVDFSQADLSKASFSGANLTRSIFRKANLERANLAGVQALRVDFSEAILNNACIDGWGTNSYTRFKDVQCERIYLEDGFNEPKPDSGLFQPGDFEKIIIRSSKTLDLFFRDGIDPQAFDHAFAKLREKHKDAEIASVETFSDGIKIVHVDMKAPQEARSNIHQKFFVDYDKEITAAQQENMRLLEELNSSKLIKNKMREKLVETTAQLKKEEEYSKFLREFSLLQVRYANLPGKYASHILTEGGDFMPSENQNIEISSSGDVTGISGGDISGVVGKENIGIVQGDFEGTLNLTLDRLRNSEEEESLRLFQLLEDLKVAIEAEESELSEKEKQKSLNHLNSIGELGADRKNPSLRERAESAIDALTGILGKGHKLWSLASPILIGIRSILGL